MPSSIRILAIIQARMGSSRFPGKILHKVNGKALLQYLLESLDQCRQLSAVIVATSIDSTDVPVEQFCRELQVPCHRGSANDVSGRFLEIIKERDETGFVRINGDSPLMDHRIVDQAISFFQSSSFDLVTNVLKRSFPKGQSVEVIDTETFIRTYPYMNTEEEKEHVTPYFYRHADQFRIYNMDSGGDYGHIQLSVDTPEDMEQFQRIVYRLNRPHWEYTYQDFLSAIR